jgi:uncharacterized metal-binding protein
MIIQANKFHRRGFKDKSKIQNLKSKIEMPSGKTHDAITFLLVLPTSAAAWALTLDLSIAVSVTLAFLFGGLMFGPDLDTHSKQYTRWSVFKLLWYPYQAFFAHRSRWSHGLVFGTFLRVIYFMGVLTLMSFFFSYIYLSVSGGELPNLLEFTKTWQSFGDWVRLNLGVYVFPAIFIGLWIGAASHTFTDMAGTFIKTGKITDFI